MTSIIRKAFRFAKNAANSLNATKVASKQGLQTRSFDVWQPEFDEVLETLPESPNCPHELYRELVQNSGPVRKRIILVSEKDDPVALACFRERSGYWEPVTQWLIPGVIFPVKEEYIWRVLGAMSLPLHIAWWRWPIPPSSFPWIKDIIASPTHGISCSEDFEVYWRQTSKKHFINIKTVRKRCSEFEFRINDRGMREWTIMNWGAKWGQGEKNGMPDLSDRLLVAEYLEKKELLYTLSLHDRETPIAGATILVHNNDSVAYVNHRHQEYGYYGVMNRLIDLSFFWSKEKAFNRIDLGGSADYKKKWAPEAGQKYQFRISPTFSIF